MSSKQYLKKLEGTSTLIATRYKPAFSDSEYTGFGELYRNGKWYKDVAVFADDFSTDTSGSYVGTYGTSSVLTGQLKYTATTTATFGIVDFSIDGLIDGKKYSMRTDFINGPDIERLISRTYDSTYSNILTSSDWTIYSGKNTLNFTSVGTTSYFRFTVGQDLTSGDFCAFESITIIPLNDDGSIDISNATELTTPQTYLPIEVDVDEQGNLLNVDRMDLPTLVEDYVYGKTIKSDEFKGKNACTAWVNFDGTTTPPTIRDSYNVSSVIRTATGKYDIYFENPLDNNHYSFFVTSFGTIQSGTISASVYNTSYKFGAETSNASGSPTNYVNISVMIFGGKDQ